jgi:uncharacterized protein with HEPN domain
MRPDDVTRIRHMIEAADAAARFLTGKSRDDLDSDEVLLFVLVRAIEIIGRSGIQNNARNTGNSTIYHGLP